jgi:hypothetical protein
MKLDTCGCCELAASTPATAANRPGLSAIVFRAGTYASFRQSMLQRIAATQALSALQTRSDDDYAITILDMWATVADVLTFYQERIANEGYLRTARLRDSVLRMARLLDYQLRPGVAATTLLAFTLDKGTGSLQIPAGLRVQSVPAEGEKPQIYETLELLAASFALNSLRILAAPEGFNPLAKGSTSGLLDPGPQGAAAAAALASNDRFVIFATAGGQIEELVVRELRNEEGRITLAWRGPIQNSNWSFDSRAYAVDRTFRIFGNNAPSQYMEAVETPSGSGDFAWHRRTFSSFSYSPSGTVIELDAKYEGITAGSQMLICQPGVSNTLATVRSVSQGHATFLAPSAFTSPVQDTVTRVTLSTAPFISDRRTAIIHEIKGSRIRFWGYRYPEVLTSATVLAPARRLDEDNVEIAGVVLPLDTLAPGRQVILRDAALEPITATVNSVAGIGLDVKIATTADDLTSAIELKLVPELAQAMTGLRSAELPAALGLSNAFCELLVTMGSLSPRTVKLSSVPNTIASAAAALQNALRASLPLTPEFAQSTVVSAENTLLVFSGLPGVPIAFASTSADPTTAAELGLMLPDAFRIDALRSGDLTSFPVLSNPLRQLSVAFGPIGPRTVSLGSAPGSLALARVLLNNALIAADPAPAFRRALVTVTGSQLLIVPGTGGASIQEFLAITLEPEQPLQLNTASAVLLGNVALSSHGETVADEALGDGDASQIFQKFELQKNPLTYVPSAGPGGTESSLQVKVNDILWSEVPSLFGKGPAEQIYTTRLADDGTVTVGFGDGLSGARLPSGRGNVVADYRHGSGLAGRVAAGALRAPLDLPVGLKSVANPAEATGGADPESLDQARENAPTTVRTFGRAVSLRDFEDLVRSSGEVAKALATWVWNRETRAVHLTIGAQEGLLFDADDLTRIYASLSTQRDPNHTLFLDNYTQVAIVVTAVVHVKSNYVASKVEAAARTALLVALSFETLGFGMPLGVSDIYTVLQQVEGVEFVDIDLFHFKNRTPAFLATRGATIAPVQRSLRIFSARPNSVPWPPVLAAEQAVVETPGEDIQIVTSGGLPD